MQSTRGQVHLLDKEEIAAFALRTRMWESRNIPTLRKRRSRKAEGRKSVGAGEAAL